MNRNRIRTVLSLSACAILILAAPRQTRAQSLTRQTEQPVASTDNPLPAETFQMVDPAEPIFGLEPRSDIGVGIGGGRGVLISPSWVMTASHCVSSKRNGVVTMKYLNAHGKMKSVNTDMLFRSDRVDVAIAHLVEPVIDLQPVLLINEGFPVATAKQRPLLLKKVSTKANIWDNIPANVREKSRGAWFYVAKANRRGKAGTSGSPYVMTSSSVGEVLVGITHGGGRIAQVGYISQWIEQTVRRESDDIVVWATIEQAFNGQDEKSNALHASRAGEPHPEEPRPEESEVE